MTAGPRRTSGPGRAARRLAGAVLIASAVALPAQADDRELATPDGSRFVLLPDSDRRAAPVLHWTIAVPSGPYEDRAGLEGLARAAARASLAGTIEYGSEDWALERPQLETLDRYEREIDVRRANEEPIPEKLETDRREASAVAARLADPGAWRRALGEIPAIPHPLVEAEAAILLTITVAPADLEPLARLILDWREHAVLRGVRNELETVRAELRAAHDTPRRALRREVLGLAYLGSPAARTVARFPSSYSRQDALEVWQAAVHPRRIRHVITGGYDPAAVRRVLDAVFVRTDLPPVTRQAPPMLAPGLRRKSEVPTEGILGVAIACAIPPGADPTTLEIVMRWLADGPGCRLESTLRGRGLRGLDLRYRNPFPDRAGAGLVLFEALAPGTAPSRANAPDLLEAITGVIDSAVTEGPRQGELNRVVRAIRAERAAEAADPVRLGRSVAIDWGIRERPLSATLGDPATPDSSRVRALAEQLWNEMPRSTAHLTRSP